MALESNPLVARAKGLASKAIDDDLVILNLEQDNYIALDAIGRRIWELIESPCRVDDLCRRLASEFDGSPEQIAGDVARFLEELGREKMLDVADERSS